MHYVCLLSCVPYIFIVFILDGKVSEESKSRESLSGSESESEDEREIARSSVLVKKASKRPLEETSKRPRGESESEDEREIRSSVLVKKASKRPLEETSKRPLEEKGDEEDEFPLYFGHACFLSCAPYIVIMCCFRW